MRGTDTGRLVAGHGCCSRGGEPRSVSGWKPGASDAATGRTALLSKLVSIVMGGLCSSRIKLDRLPLPSDSTSSCHV